jgi:N-methylhydantoinase B
VGVAVGPGDRFEMMCASGGGYGDPLDRDPQAVREDLCQSRVDADTARNIYGVILTKVLDVDPEATLRLRNSLRSERLKRARPAALPVSHLSVGAANGEANEAPLHPGVIQRGEFAVAEESRAVLAIAPGNWLDGCPVLDMSIDERGGGIIARAHLDPVTGRMLFVDVIRTGGGPSIEICPERWAQASREAAPQRMPA